MKRWGHGRRGGKGDASCCVCQQRHANSHNLKASTCAEGGDAGGLVTLLEYHCESVSRSAWKAKTVIART